MQISNLRIVAASELALTMAFPAVASSVTYAVSGTFADGGTFDGNFNYDPIANSYSVPNSNPNFGATGVFDITTTAGSSQVGGRRYQPGTTTTTGYSDVNSSTPTELYIDGCCNEGTTNLILDWNTPLNAAAGESPQPIVGGSETFQPFYEFPAQTRQVAGGVVELSTSPVPLPATVWLILSGLIGLAAWSRPRKIQDVIGSNAYLACE